LAASARSRRVILALVAAAVVFGLVAGGYFFFYLPYVKAQESQAQATRFLMDTSVDISAFGRDAETYVKQAFGEMERLEEVLSRHIVHSEVAKINSSAGEWVSVSEPTIEVISLGLEIGELTKGAFDITVGVLVSLWGFGTGDYKVPSSEEIAEALATIDYRKVELMVLYVVEKFGRAAIVDIFRALTYSVEEVARALDKLSELGLLEAVKETGQCHWVSTPRGQELLGRLSHCELLAQEVGALEPQRLAERLWEALAGLEL
jgi:hypothetical protein